MGSLGKMEGGLRGRKAMWLYPKVTGFNPSERWGHSACFSNGVVYIFGGCCGGLHFSDVLTLNLVTMAWKSLATTGQKPGSRDSHSAALVGDKIFVFGGTNGSKKVNDLHILDLKTKEWVRAICKGTPPSPRESHTATVVGEGKLVIFGGSGEGESNYLNDVHILELTSMTWTSPDVKGDFPAPRDSHTAVAVANKLIIYGGDCGDRYHGEVDVLDMDNMTWSRLAIQGTSPGVRAGHAAATIGDKMYVIGGVSEKHYYSDVWVLDLSTSTWTQLDICGQTPQGRFSHTAVATDTDITIYGGCGEDERPLNELLILQLGSEHPNGRYNVSMCKIFGKHWSQEKRNSSKGAEILQRNVQSKNGELRQRFHETEEGFHGPDNLPMKRRKAGDAKVNMKSEQEEHTLSLSQSSSPSHSDQEQNTAQKLPSSRDSSMASQQFSHLKLHSRREQANGTQKSNHDTHVLDSPRPPSKQQKPHLRPLVPPLIGAEVRGTVDGAFDSGYLMTANVNGQIFRGVLFAPVPIIAAPRPTIHCQPLSLGNPIVPQQSPTPSNAIPAHVRPFLQLNPECGQHIHHASPVRAMKSHPPRPNNDLQGVVLTLGGPGGGSHDRDNFSF